MNDEFRQNTTKKRVVKASKECAYLAVFVALVIAVQLCFAFLPGVEAVTLLFVAYAFAFGIKRGMLAATCFSLLRQLLFGFFPVVLVLYLVYFNLLSVVFGFLGKRVDKPSRSLWRLTAVACLCTVGFTLFDNILTPLWYRYTSEAARAYFFASLPVLLPQVICTAATVACLFLPLEKIFRMAKKRL